MDVLCNSSHYHAPENHIFALIWVSLMIKFIFPNKPIKKLCNAGIYQYDYLFFTFHSWLTVRVSDECLCQTLLTSESFITAASTITDKCFDE